MWRLIAKLLGFPGGRVDVGPGGEREPPRTRADAPGTPEDSPAPQQPPAEPAPAAPDQGEVKPAHLPYAVPAPSRNGTHARH